MPVQKTYCEVYAETEGFGRFILHNTGAAFFTGVVFLHTGNRGRGLGGAWRQLAWKPNGGLCEMREITHQKMKHLVPGATSFHFQVHSPPLSVEVFNLCL